MVRNPVVAGQFYPGSKEALKRDVGALIDANADKKNVIGAVSPHAGYAYSGKVAGATLSLIKPKRTYIILGPNHTGLGANFAIDTNEAWNTLLGSVRIDSHLADRIEKDCPYIKYDGAAHEHEHSIEVQLPFLQILQKDFAIVPICAAYADPGAYGEIGAAIAASVKGLRAEKDVAIIASSDMTHYESASSAKEKDSAAIGAILRLDEKSLIRKVAEMDISMCGYAPAAIMLAAAKELGAKSARLVDYRTSGDATGDYSSVVGYAGIIIL